MATSSRRLIGLLLAASALAGGCADPRAPSGSTDKAKVAGTVRRQGKPVSGGTIVFNPANSERKMVSSNSAEIGDDGTYTVETLVGGNGVNIFPDAADSKHALKDVKAKKAPPGRGSPGGYRGRFDAKAGDNVFDIEM